MKMGEVLSMKLVQYGTAQPTQIRGCNDSEIQEMMEAQRVSFLPPIYISFLQWLGKNAGSWRKQVEWSTYTYPDLLNMKVDSELDVPNDAFVFWTNGVFLSKYFLTSDHNQNPQIYEVSDTFNDRTSYTLAEDLLYFVKSYEGNEVYSRLLSSVDYGLSN